MDLELAGKTALVVGAAGSMGEAVTQGFLDEGAAVVACDMEDRLAEVNQGAERIAIDVTSPESVRQAEQAAVASRGRIDVLVMLAGIYQAKPVVDIEPEEWDRLMNVNLRGTFLLAREVLPLMKSSDFGRMVLIASLAGQVGGMVAGAHYAASKAGVLSLVKSLAKQSPEPWITVNAVSPGPMQGAMTDAWPAEDRERMLETIPMGRFARPREIADAVLFLSSPRTGYIHGARIDVNGGVHMD
ncbi:MAG: SDR family oxidoreductase [Planctomycetales bacterium]